jgi:hypothetical protein
MVVSNRFMFKVLCTLSILALVVVAMSCGSSVGVDKSVSSTYTISGYVFLDGNSDGVYNTGDTPDAGIKVLLKSTSSPTMSSLEATTNANGFYSMSVAQGYVGVMVVDDGDEDAYLPPFCYISGDPSMDKTISFHR